MQLKTPIPILQKLTRYPLDIAILSLLLCLYGPLLWHWVDGWLNKSISIQHEYFSHGLLGIPFAAYIAWTLRRKWVNLPDSWHPAGLGLVALGTIFYLSGLPDGVNISFPIMLAGTVLLLKGLAGLRLYGFPLVLVLLATPTQVPYLIEPYALPLQRFIAAVAGFILSQLGIQVTVDDIYLLVNSQLVEVAPHCAGLKILFTALYVGLMLTYWTGVWRSKLQTGIFFVGIIFISVSGNILRNTILSFFHGTYQEDMFDWFHEGWGGDMYSGIMLLLLVVWLSAIQKYVPSRVNLKVDTSTL